MDNKKQKLLIELLISSPDTFALCQGIVKASYFDPEYRNAVGFIKDYYDKYNTTPEPVQIEAESGQQLTKHEVKRDQVLYCANQIEEFCKDAAMEKAILDSVVLLQEKNRGAIQERVKEALLVSLNRDLGLRYYEDPEGRLKEMLESGNTEPTGWSEIDHFLFGGISRQELLLVSANSGGGKSICLANLGLNFSERGFNVLYASLELSEKVIAQRFDTMLTGIGRKDWKQHVSEIAVRVMSAGQGKGHIDIKQFPVGTNAIQLHAYLKEYYLHFGYMPDMLILDYVDLMHPNEKIDLTDLWTKDKLCSEQLRDIGVRHNMFIATASQLNRSAVGATHQTHDQIAGGISKINTADVYWSIVMNQTQKAKGEIAFCLQKTRNSDGVGNTIHLKWDNKHLRILDRDNIDGGSGPLTFNKRVKDKPKSVADSILEDMSGKDGLMDLMSSTS